MSKTTWAVFKDDQDIAKLNTNKIPLCVCAVETSHCFDFRDCIVWRVLDTTATTMANTRATR